MTETHHVEIQPATLPDAQAIAEIHVASWQTAYANLLPASFLQALSVEKRVLMWRNMLEVNQVHASIARVSDRTVGWIAYGKCRDNDKDATWGEIEAIYLSPDCFRRGIGTQLIEHALQALRALAYEHTSLWVLSDNTRARACYESLGFAEDGQVRSIKIGGSPLLETRYSRKL